MQARFDPKKRLRRWRQAKGVACEIGYVLPTENLLLYFSSWFQTAVWVCVAEDDFDPSTSGLWAQHASAAPLCFFSPQMGLRTHNPWLRSAVPYPLGHWGQSAASRQPQLH